MRWASALARYTAARREQLGLTVTEAAELSGLQISEWLGLEDGWVPEDVATLRAIAGALRVRWMDYHTLAFLAECHQKC
jgi:transcriptional regulator with XRE-family HTH domain